MMVQLFAAFRITMHCRLRVVNRPVNHRRHAGALMRPQTPLAKILDNEPPGKSRGGRLHRIEEWLILNWN
jgi:hypothetical protein